MLDRLPVARGQLESVRPGDLSRLLPGPLRFLFYLLFGFGGNLGAVPARCRRHGQSNPVLVAIAGFVDWLIREAARLVVVVPALALVARALGDFRGREVKYARADHQFFASAFSSG
jgi:hypothetical protein